MKKLYKKVARYFVTKFNTRLYRLAINYAEKRHAEEHRTIYVIDSPNDESQLLVIGKREFLYIRKQLGISSKSLPEAVLKARCWYYTENENNKGKMPARDMEIRRLAFLRDRLLQKHLIEDKKAE